MDRIDCFYGPPGSAKSRYIAAIIAKVYNETGKVARVAVGDGSACTYADLGLVDAGVVEVLDYSMRDWPLTVMQQISEGYWPADVNDPKSPLLPPNPEAMAKIGVYGLEGLSVCAQYIMGDKKGGLAERAGRGEKIGQDSPVQVVDIERHPVTGQPIPKSGSGLAFGGNPLAHFNFAQRRILGYIERSKALPGWVIWTAHEKSGEDKTTGEKVIGPEAAGSALTAGLPRHFGNTLHCTTAMKKAGKKVDTHTQKQVEALDIEYRIYTRDHYDPDGLTFTKYIAVSRVAKPEIMPLYIVSEKAGEGILEFYSIVAKARKQAMEELVGKKAS